MINKRSKSIITFDDKFEQLKNLSSITFLKRGEKEKRKEHTRRGSSSAFFSSRRKDDRMACLKVHIWGKYNYEVAGNDSYIELKCRREKLLRGEGGRGGIVTKFSRKSRVNFFKKVNDIDLTGYDRENIQMFTLTYEPSGESVKINDGKRYKKDIDNFRRWLVDYCDKKNTDCFVVWLREWHRSGIPHYHMIIVWERLLCDDISDHLKIMMNDFAFAWKRIQGGSNKVIRAFWKPEVVKSDVVRYMGSYLGKMKGYQKVVPEGFENCGRFWGIFNRKMIKWKEKVSKKISIGILQEVRELFISELIKRGGDRKKYDDVDIRSNLLVFGVNISELLEKIENMKDLGNDGEKSLNYFIAKS